MILPDVSKAFKGMNHKQLLAKLEVLHISSYLPWVASFLGNRSIEVQIEEVFLTLDIKKT